jgi:hypothetical protein
MSEEKKTKLIASIESSRKSLSRAIDYLNNDFDTSIFEIREVQCKLNATMMAIKDIRGDFADFSLRNISYSEAYSNECIN